MIRLFGLRDVLGLKALQPVSVSLDLRREVLYRPAPLRSAVLGYLTRHHFGPLTWMCEGVRGEPGIQGFAQVWPSAWREDWSLGAVAPAPDVPGAEWVWRELLNGLVRRAAEHGRPRILARVPEDSEVEHALRAGGFLAATKEELFCLTRPLKPVASPRNLFSTRSSDAWAIGELYRQVVPRHVQEAEASVGHGCGTPGGYLFGARAVEERIWMEEGRANAYFALSAAPLGHWLEVLVRPEHRTDILPHIRYILSRVDVAPHRPVYCSVPDYAVGVGWMLRTLSFQSLHRQVQMVMHVAARLPLRRPSMVAGLEAGVDIRAPVGTVNGWCAGRESGSCA